MSKPYWLPLSALLLTACSQNQPSGKIIIANNSPNPITITNISIQYQSAQKTDPIANIAANSTYQYLINYPSHEDTLILNYTDNNNQPHSKIIDPYAANYDKKTYRIIINESSALDN